MLFLINNPLIMVIVIILSGFIVFMGVKIYREIMLNRMLRQKHGVMRISEPKTRFNKRLGIMASTALAPVIVIALVLSLGSSTRITPAGDIVDIRNGSDVLDLYESFEEKMQSYSVFRGFMTIEESLDGGPEMDNAAGGDDVADYEGSDVYSKTNNQVIGVDEMDNVVTDGLFMYTIHENRVVISVAYTTELEANALAPHKEIEYVNEEDCPNGFYATGLYVDDDYLVVVGSEHEYNCLGYQEESEDDYKDMIYDSWYGYNDNVKIYVYDKSDNFSLDSEYSLSGNLIGTRKIDDDLYVVTNRNIPFNKDDVEIDDYLPSYETAGVTVEADYGDIVYVDGMTPNSFTSFYALDLDHQQVDMEVVLADSGYNLYVSPNNIYLVGNIYYFYSIAEYVDIEEPVAETKTAIMKVTINGPDVEYFGVGEVEGYTLNQFSMDEYDGNLRIATTTGSWGDINNRVFILDENLQELSRIEGLGKPGETIKSTRFIGDYGYVVTFEQTDPFYVLNLSDPDNPIKEGELEITGFSSYLQPLNNDYMLGIGFGDNSGGTNGLKISIYDISDKSNPTPFDEVIFDYEEFGWGDSSATYNHKDLLVSLSKGIIALPFSTYNYESGTYSYDSGILIYDFDEVLGLTQKGFVRHETGINEDIYVYKSKFIDDYFYTISNKYIKVSSLETPEVIIKEITLD